MIPIWVEQRETTPVARRPLMRRSTPRNGQHSVDHVHHHARISHKWQWHPTYPPNLGFKASLTDDQQKSPLLGGLSGFLQIWNIRVCVRHGGVMRV